MAKRALAMLLVCVFAMPAAVGGAATPCPQGYGAYRAGAAKTDITPRAWPVAMAAYSIGRTATSAADRFYSRALAIQLCRTGQVVVFVAMDAQGYFAAYKEDPGPGADGFGLDAIRLSAQNETRVPESNIMIATTHTHNAPDTIGLWGGSVTDNNKSPYLAMVKQRTVLAITNAVGALRPAEISLGSVSIADLISTPRAVAHDSAYPLDSMLRVLTITDRFTDAPISTLVDAGVHATVAGEIPVLTTDWPGRVSRDLDAANPGQTSLVFVSGVGRQGPRVPPEADAADDLGRVARYGDLIFARVRAAIASSTSVPPTDIDVADTRILEEVSEPAVALMFLHEEGTPVVHGLMRSTSHEFMLGPVIVAEIQTIRLGDMVFAGTPGEEYPEDQTELARRIIGAREVFTMSLANDQIGYTPPTPEYLVAWCYTSDEGIFTINPHIGDDVLNQHLKHAQLLGFSVDAPYTGATAHAPLPVPPAPCSVPLT